MRRIASKPRRDWRDKVEETGLIWHSGQQSYWDESAFYSFTATEVDALESATNELFRMTLHAAQHIIDNRLYSRMAIPESAIGLIESAWAAQPSSVYGRFDLAYDGDSPPKLLEYNADTPTSLLEAAVVQWQWLEDVSPSCDQFNSIHDRLIARWRELTPHLPGERVDFCSIDDLEDGMTATYLLDTARQAGLDGSIFPIDQIGWDGASFLGPDDQPLRAIFKLYPWEWMVREEYGEHLDQANTIWIEPPWKMLLSNKGILPVLWTLYPHHPNLLPAYFEDSSHAMTCWVKKPLLGREGANITLHHPSGDFTTSGEYGSEGFIYQRLADIKSFDGMHRVIGSWVVGCEDSAAGIGIRESETPVITNTSRFVPHIIT